MSIVDDFNRILSKNGSIVLVEHNSDGDDFNKLLDLQHMIYDTVISQNITYTDYKKTYYSNYKSENKWNMIFSKFKPLHTIHTKKIDKTYFCIYKKM